MKFRKTPIAMALAGGLLLSGATLATPDTFTLYTVEPVAVQEIAIVEFQPVSEPMYLAGFEVIEPASVTYYLTTSQNPMPNPVPPSQSDSWGE